MSNNRGRISKQERQLEGIEGFLVLLFNYLFNLFNYFSLLHIIIVFRQEMAKRRTAASAERMRIISQLAKREKKEDNFGMKDEDWDVYKTINKVYFPF